MKKSSLAIACAAISICLAADAAPQRFKLVVTQFPLSDWICQTLGAATSRCDIALLQRGGADMHSYTPSAADLRRIAACDLFICIGGESDAWTQRALAQPGNPRRRTLRLLDAPGIAAKKEKGGDDLDEHIWLSLRRASVAVGAIAEALKALDPESAVAFQDNAYAYRLKLSALDRAYSAAIAAVPAERRTLLVADRFPFRYLADDYGLTGVAAFHGCSAESEASFKTVMTLARTIDELNIPVIFVLEGSDRRLAETVRRTTKRHDQRIMTLDSMQSSGGATSYLDAMAANLEALKSALGG